VTFWIFPNRFSRKRTQPERTEKAKSLIAKAHDDDTRQEFANATALASLAVQAV
jgi:hypothetical protein